MTTDLDVVCTAYLGEMARLRALLDADPDLLNDRTTDLSPLCWAAYGDQVEAATELLARGARMSHHELFCAAACGHARVARVLLAHGAGPNERDERGATALMIAAAIPYTRDTTELVRVLLEAGADVHARTPRGASALTVAVLGGARQASERVPPLKRKQYALVADLLKAYGAKA
jgi:ankyrin repeat protein